MLIKATDTQIKSYNQIVADGTAKKQSGLYLYALTELGEATDREVDKMLKIGIRQVSRSRGELGDKIISIGQVKDLETNRKVNVYKVNPNPDLFSVKKISSQKRNKLLRDLCNGQLYVSAGDVIKILNS